MTAGRGYNETTGKTVYVLALTPADLARLSQGLPLHGSLAHLGLHAEVFLCSGALAEQFTRPLED